VSDKPDTLSGLRFSAGLLIALGGFLALYVPFYLFVLCVLLFRPLRSHSISPDHHLASLVLTIFGAAALSYLCFRSGSALKDAQRWATYVARGWGLFLIYFGSRIMIDLFRPYQPGAVHGEDLFEFLIAVPCIIVGVWWCVYLSLPYVRKAVHADPGNDLSS
jgi:arginine exporter protein ArgO